MSLPEDQQIHHIYEYGFLAEPNDVMARMHGFSHGWEIEGIPVYVSKPIEAADLFQAIEEISAVARPRRPERVCVTGRARYLEVKDLLAKGRSAIK